MAFLPRPAEVQPHLYGYYIVFYFIYIILYILCILIPSFFLLLLFIIKKKKERKQKERTDLRFYLFTHVNFRTDLHFIPPIFC